MDLLRSAAATDGVRIQPRLTQRPRAAEHSAAKICPLTPDLCPPTSALRRPTSDLCPLTSPSTLPARIWIRRALQRLRLPPLTRMALVEPRVRKRSRGSALQKRNGQGQPGTRFAASVSSVSMVPIRPWNSIGQRRRASPASASRSEASASDQVPGAAWRKRRALGYQGESLRRRSQRQSG